MMSTVLVLVEHVDGTASKPTLELLTLARRLGTPAALMYGEPSTGLTGVLGQYGAATVYAVPPEHPYPAAALAQAVVEVAARTAPAAVLAPSSPLGKEVAARAAVRLDSGIITDATDVRATPDGPVTTQAVFAGSLFTECQVRRGTPIITVRPNAVAAEPAPTEPV